MNVLLTEELLENEPHSYAKLSAPSSKINHDRYDRSIERSGQQQLDVSLHMIMCSGVDPSLLILHSAIVSGARTPMPTLTHLGESL